MDMRSSEPELRAWMIAGLAGDAAAYKALLNGLSVQLRGYFKGHLRRIGRDPIEAEDLVQDVLMAIHTRRHTYDPAQLLTPWVYGISRYKFLDYLQKTKATNKDVPIENAEALTVHDDRAQVESNLDLEKLLEGVSPKTRQLIRDVKLDGLSTREAAARSGMSESAVKVAVHRGLKALSLLIARRPHHEY